MSRTRLHYGHSGRDRLREELSGWPHLDWNTQEAMLHAAATALHLAAEGRITARGRRLRDPAAATPCSW
jgi:hypothetical protein